MQGLGFRLKVSGLGTVGRGKEYVGINDRIHASCTAKEMSDVEGMLKLVPLAQGSKSL